MGNWACLLRRILEVNPAPLWMPARLSASGYSSAYRFRSRPTAAAECTIGVFVALADNRHQGIGYVPRRAGRGDDPENNVYWGSADALVEVFRRDPRWKLVEKSGTDADSLVLRTRLPQCRRGRAAHGEGLKASGSSAGWGSEARTGARKGRWARACPRRHASDGTNDRATPNELLLVPAPQADGRPAHGQNPLAPLRQHSHREL